MKIMKVGDYEIVPFAGFYKIKDISSGERVGTIYPTYKEAYAKCIEMERERLGIVIGGR